MRRLRFIYESLLLCLSNNIWIKQLKHADSCDTYFMFQLVLPAVSVGHRLPVNLTFLFSFHRFVKACVLLPCLLIFISKETCKFYKADQRKTTKSMKRSPPTSSSQTLSAEHFALVSLSWSEWVCPKPECIHLLSASPGDETKHSHSLEENEKAYSKCCYSFT